MTAHEAGDATGSLSAPPSMAARVRAILSWRRLTGPSSVLIGTTAAINVLRVLNIIVLTRLLSPSDFGLIGIVLSIFFVIGMVTDAGFQSFVVRHQRGTDPHFLDAVWTVHVARALMNTVIGIALSLPLAWLLDKPNLAPLLAVASLTLAIDGAASLSLFVALREGMVRRLSIVDLVAFLIQLVAGLTAAWALHSVWAIVLAMFTTSIVRTVASYVVFPQARRRLTYDAAIASELWRFSRLIAASSTLTLIISQFDKLVLARVFSLSQFGVYTVANNLTSAPVALANMYTSRIVYPSLAEAWRIRPAELKRHFYAMRGIVFYGYLAGAGALGGGADLIVHVLYDPRYHGASFYIRILAVTTAMTMLTRPVNELLVASERVRVTLEANIVRVVWLAMAAPAGLVWMGPTGLIVALALIELPAYMYMTRKLIRYDLFSWRHELLAFATIGAGAALGWSVAYVGAALLPGLR